MTNRQKRSIDTKLRNKVIEYVNNNENFSTLDITMHFRDEYDTIPVLLVLEELYMTGRISKEAQ
jgi:hypothetical protein